MKTNNNSASNESSRSTNTNNDNNDNNNNRTNTIFKRCFPALVGVMLFVFILGLSLFYIAGALTLFAFNLASCFTLIGAISLVVLFVVMKNITRAEVNVMTLSSGEASQSGVKQTFMVKRWQNRRWKKMFLVFIF